MAEFMMTAEHLSNEYDINNGEGVPGPMILKVCNYPLALASTALTRNRIRKMVRSRL